MYKIHKSWENNAPSLISGESGGRSFITVLEAILVSGYNLVVIDSIVRNGTIATATVSAGVSFSEYNIVLITGADQSAYNGEHRVISCTSTTFSFVIDEATPTPATGTITVKMAPAGWTKEADDGAQRAVFRFSGGNRHYLHVDETTKEGLENASGIFQTVAISAIESFADIDTYTNKTSDSYIKKTSISTESYWVAIVSDRFMLFATTPDLNFIGFDIHYFGEMESFVPSDLYCTFASAHYKYYLAWNNIWAYYYGTHTYNNSVQLQGNLTRSISNEGLYILRDYSGAVTNIPFKFVINSMQRDSHKIGSGAARGQVISLIDGSILMNEIYLMENDCLRGKLKDCYDVIEGSNLQFDSYYLSLSKNMQIGNKYTDMFFMALHVGASYGTLLPIAACFAIDIFGDD